MEILSLLHYDIFRRCSNVKVRAGPRTLIWGGGGYIFIYSGSARLISFEMSCY